MSTPSRVRSARAVAWRIVREVHRDGAWTGPAVDRALRRSGLDVRDRAFASNLAFQTLRWEGTLDWALGQVVRRPFAQVDEGLRDLLRIGAWQLLYGRMPDRAAVSATVDVARAELGARTVGFANGVLRNLARRQDALPWPAPTTVAGRALRAGYPAWIVEAATARFGADADGELDAGNVPGDLTIRAAAPETLRSELQAAGANVRPGTLVSDTLHVEGMAPGDLLDRWPMAVIQDEASTAVGLIAAAAVAQGGAMLDVCAAPGGKATHLAALGRRVTAADRNHSRLGLVGALADRLALPVALVTADGARPPWRPGAFDGVLLDAPCSGLGVVRRRPELRWRRGEADVMKLAALQRDLLDASATAVAPGGALIYSVCTWTLAETVGVVAGFLDATPEFRAEPVELVGRGSGVDGGVESGLQLTPARDGCDGMFVAVLRRAVP